MPTSNGLRILHISALLQLFQVGCTLEVYNQSALPRCGNGSCPTGTYCTPADQRCVADTEDCGNSHVDPGEVCDDGNQQDGDGCARDCRSIETCGNGVIDSQAASPETCDDGASNGTFGDPCSATCQAVGGLTITGVADPKFLISGTPVSSSAHAVLKMIFENRTPGTNVSLCAGTLDDFVQGRCSMQLSGSGGPGFQFLTIIDANELSGKVLYAIRAVGTAPAQFVLTIE